MAFLGRLSFMMGWLAGLVVFSGLLKPPMWGVQRFEVFHADPYVVVMLLVGQSPPYPEVSTVMGGRAFLAGEGDLGGVRGRFVVNPADNSIWFIPSRSGS